MAYPFCQKVYFRGFTMWALQCLKVFHVLKLLFTSEKTMGLQGVVGVGGGGGGWGDRDHAVSVVCVTDCVYKEGENSNPGRTSNGQTAVLHITYTFGLSNSSKSLNQTYKCMPTIFSHMVNPLLRKRLIWRRIFVKFQECS